MCDRLSVILNFSELKLLTNNAEKKSWLNFFLYIWYMIIQFDNFLVLCVIINIVTYPYVVL